MSSYSPNKAQSPQLQVIVYVTCVWFVMSSYSPNKAQSPQLQVIVYVTCVHACTCVYMRVHDVPRPTRAPRSWHVSLPLPQAHKAKLYLHEFIQQGNASTAL
jgi:hypothetical protein